VTKRLREGSRGPPRSARKMGLGSDLSPRRRLPRMQRGMERKRNAALLIRAQLNQGGSRVCSAPLRAALRPGQEQNCSPGFRFTHPGYLLGPRRCTAGALPRVRDTQNLAMNARSEIRDSEALDSRLRGNERSLLLFTDQSTTAHPRASGGPGRRMRLCRLTSEFPLSAFALRRGAGMSGRRRV
jgi:hypothetical protein